MPVQDVSTLQHGKRPEPIPVPEPSKSSMTLEGDFMDKPQETPFFETVLSCVADGVFTVDLDWRITSFNRAAERITGVPAVEAIGKRCSEVFHADICERGCAIRRTMESGAEVIDMRARILNHRGRAVPISISTALLRDTDLSFRSWGIEEPAIPRWQRALLWALRPVLAFAVRRMLGVTPARAARAWERTREAFDDMDKLLADGRRYLTGETLTFADITFASLGALAVLPPEYPGDRLGGRRMAVTDIRDPRWRAEVEELRARPSGQFILRLYREERLPRAG